MKKLNIGLFVDQLDRSYQSLMWHTVSNSLKNKGHNCIIFSGKTFNVPFIDDQSQNSVYSLAQTSSLDGLLSITGLLTSRISLAEYSLFLKKLAPLPIVSIDTCIEGYPSVVVDNKSGIIDAVDHLVQDHGRRNIFFIGGPQKHWESKERREGYEQGLKKNGLPFREDFIYLGDFSEESGKAAASYMLEHSNKEFDAVISINDSMLTGALDILFENGIEVPADMSAIGFDNSMEAQVCLPSLTSISQPYEAMVEEAISSLLAVIKHRKAKELITLPTSLVIRESCGCSHPVQIHHGQGTSSVEVMEKIQTGLTSLLEKDLAQQKKGELFLKNAKRGIVRDLRNGIDLSSSPTVIQEFERLLYKTVKDDQERGIYTTKVHELRKYYIRMLINSHQKTALDAERHQLNLMRINQALIAPRKRSALLGSIRYNFPLLGISYTKLIEFGGPVTWDGRLGWSLPEKSRVTGEYGLDRNDILKEGIEVDTMDWVPKWINAADNPVTLILMPLTFQRKQIGLILMNEGQGIDIMYESLRGQISSAINGINLLDEQAEYSRKLRKMYHELEKSHDRIERISITDELTGLYNRRGFSTVAGRIIELAKRTDRNILVIYIDLDGLKIINDNFGHNEGDLALQNAAKLLQNTFRTSDIIARLGGDEFIILGVDIEKDVLDSILKRLYESIEEHNKNSLKGYHLSMSTGLAWSFPGKGSDLETLMAEADALLYEEKQRKKNSNTVIIDKTK